MDTNYITLDRLPLNESAYISAIDADGTLRRRLFDLGFSGGNIITALYSSALGDPIAYGIMGSVIALRKETASGIKIMPLSLGSDDL